MRIIFIGTVLSSYIKLKKIIELKANVVGVITKKSSDFNSDYYDLSPLCKHYNIPVFYYEKTKEVLLEKWIRNLNSDIIFCFGWSHILKQNILEIPKFGVVGYHPSALPKNRGRHPIVWALGLGLKSTASTFFIMDQSIDSGSILSQKIVKIDYTDDAKSLYEKLLKTALKQITLFLPKLQKGLYVLTKQDVTKANYWRKRSTRDERIDFRMSSGSIYNLVRSLTHPYCGAHVEYKATNIKIWKVREVPYKKNNIEYGKVLSISGQNIIVKTLDGAIEILEHEFEELPQIGYYL